MSLGQAEQQLLRVSSLTTKEIRALKEGVFLEQSSQRPIDDLIAQACADRLSLAQGHLLDGDRAMRGRPPMWRTAVSRYYYAMYQAVRAVVYFRLPGDDHEAHSDLPKWLPSDFPDVERWKNALKDARLRRNEADYDPYPAGNADFRDTALQLRADTPVLIAESRIYLTAKGCGQIK